MLDTECLGIFPYQPFYSVGTVLVEFLLYSLVRVLPNQSERVIAMNRILPVQQRAKDTEEIEGTINAEGGVFSDLEVFAYNSLYNHFQMCSSKCSID